MNATLALQFAAHFDPEKLLVEGNTNQDELVFELTRNALTTLGVRLSKKDDIVAVLETVSIYDLLMATAKNDALADTKILQKYAIDEEDLDEEEVEELVS